MAHIWSKKIYHHCQSKIKKHSSAINKTKGFLPTDNFEFLADYSPVSKLNFLTDLAGVSHLKLPIDSISVGDELTFQKETSNERDSFAIKFLRAIKKLDISKRYMQKSFIKRMAKN